MRTLLRTLPLIALFCAPLQVFAGTTATMQVSFTVLASCTVDSQGAAAPMVACAQVGGYLVAPHAAGVVQAAGVAGVAGVSSVEASSAAGWTIYF